VHAAGLVAHSFVRGLVIGTLGVALGGLVARLRRRREGKPEKQKLEIPFAAIFCVFVATVPIAKIAFGWGFHDEDLITGHMSIGSEIQNDIYPPRHLSFATEPLRYHYAFNLFTAFIGTLLRTPINVSIDIASVLLWPYLAWLIYTLGDLWFGRGRGAITLLMTLFAGGIPYCLTNTKSFRITDLVGFCRVGEMPMLAPIPSNFFQHPWALGLPFAVASLLIASAHEKCRPAPRFVAWGLLLTVLSISHVVLFMTMLPSLVAAELWFIWRHQNKDRRALLSVLAMAGASIVGAAALGGASLGGQSAASSLAFAPGILKGVSNVLLWHVQSYGPALVIGLVGLYLLPAYGRVAILLLLGGSLFVLNTFHYVHSSDIVKFGAVASLALGLAGSAAISRILDKAQENEAKKRLGLRALAGALLLAATAGGLSFTLFFYWSGATRYFGVSVPRLAPDDARAASFLRTRIRPGELVFRDERFAPGYARWAGLPIPWVDWGVSAFGFPQERIDTRIHLLQSLPEDASVYHEQGITWFVLGPNDKRLRGHVDQWVKDGEATEVATFGALRVFRVLDRSPLP